MENNDFIVTNDPFQFNGALIEPLTAEAQQYCKGKSAVLAKIDGVIQATNKYPVKVSAANMKTYLRQSGYKVNA